MCDIIRIPRRSSSCGPVVTIRTRSVQPKKYVVVEEKKPQLQVLINIRSKPAPPKPKTLFYKEYESIRYCPPTILAPVRIRCHKAPEPTLRHSVNVQLPPRKKPEIKAHQTNRVDQFQPIAPQPAQQGPTGSMFAKQQEELAQQGFNQPTPSMIARHNQGMFPPTASMIANHQAQLDQQQGFAPPSASMIARHNEALAHQQAYLNQQNQSSQMNSINSNQNEAQEQHSESPIRGITPNTASMIAKQQQALATQGVSQQEPVARQSIAPPTASQIARHQSFLSSHGVTPPTASMITRQHEALVKQGIVPPTLSTIAREQEALIKKAMAPPTASQIARHQAFLSSHGVTPPTASMITKQHEALVKQGVIPPTLSTIARHQEALIKQGPPTASMIARHQEAIAQQQAALAQQSAPK